MSITLHGTPTTLNQAGVSSLAVVLPSGVANNDLIIVLFGGIVGSRTITPPSGYTQVPNCFLNATAPTSGVYYHVWQTGDPTTVTFTMSGGTTNLGAICAAYSGVNSSTPIDASQGQHDAATTTPASPSISPTGVTDMLLMIYQGFTGTTAWSAPSVGSIVASTSVSGAENGAIVDFLLSSSGATGNQTITSANAQYSAFQIALLAASNNAGVPKKRYRRAIQQPVVKKRPINRLHEEPSPLGAAVLFAPVKRPKVQRVRTALSAVRVKARAVRRKAAVFNLLTLFFVVPRRNRKLPSKYILHAAPAPRPPVRRKLSLALATMMLFVRVPAGRGAARDRSRSRGVRERIRHFRRVLGIGTVAPPVVVPPVVIHAPVVAVAQIVAPVTEVCVIHAPVHAVARIYARAR